MLPIVVNSARCLPLTPDRPSWMLPVDLRPGAALRSSALLCLILLAGGCRPSTPPDFALRLGESGGFTGWTAGYSLQPSGEVIQFTDRHDGEIERRSLGRLTAEQRDELWRRISSSIAWDAPPERGNGDLTRFLEVVADGATRRVEWTVAPPRDPEPPAVLLFTHCRDLLAGAETSPSSER